MPIIHRIYQISLLKIFLSVVLQEAYSVARQFNQIPPICEQSEYHMFQREKVEVQLPELFHKIGERLIVYPSFIRTYLMTRVNDADLSSGVGAMTWSPLACGIISGKYDSGVPPYSRASLKVPHSRRASLSLLFLLFLICGSLRVSGVLMWMCSVSSRF